MVILLIEKIDFKSKKVTRKKEEYYILIKVSTQQEDIPIINIYTRNDRPSKCMKQKLTKLKEK